jgi:hypothetical protein
MSSLRSIQRGTRKVSGPSRRPPLLIVADDTTLTPTAVRRWWASCAGAWA